MNASIRISLLIAVSLVLLSPASGWDSTASLQTFQATSGCVPGLVRIEGELKSHGTIGNRVHLLLQADGQAAFADAPSDLPDELHRKLLHGAKISVSGTCESQPGSGPVRLLIHARDWRDVTVLAPARWWTLQRAKSAVFALSLTIGAVLVWILLLRRRMRKQAAFLQSRLQLETMLEQRYHDLFENATDLVFSLDLSGRFIEANTATERALGFTRTDLESIFIWDLMQAEDVPQCRDTLRAMLGGERSGLHQTHLVTGTGAEVTIEMSWRLQYTDGAPSRVEAIGRDVTGRKLAEVALQQAREAAEAASRAKGEFLANMSHEIRTPLNGILGMTELVLEGELSNDQRANVSIVRTCAETLLSIVNDVLDFSKIEAGKMELHDSEFDLQAMLRSCVDIIAIRAAQKRVRLTCAIDPSLPDTVTGDPVRLKQIITNLLGNAEKFTPAGEIVLSAERVDTIGKEYCDVRFAVEDTGIGIRKADQARVFRSFSQGDGSSSRHYGGTGLGLAISSRLAGMMQSRIVLESEPGIGSKFSLVVRLKTKPAPTAVAPALGDRKLLLVVDGNVRSREATARILTWAGFTCICTDTLREAGAVAGRVKPALIVFDYEEDGEPEGSFTEVLPLNIPVLLLTPPTVTDTTPSTKTKVTRLRKPAMPDDLVAAVSAALHSEDLCGSANRHESSLNRLAASLGVGAHNVRPLSILLAEDNPVNQLIAVRTLEREGYQVHVAANGVEAVALAERSTFDLVLMDVQMPDMDGFQATYKIRQMERSMGRIATPIVAITAHAMSGDRERCLSAGMDDYISKPIKAADLLRIAAERARAIGTGS